MALMNAYLITTKNLEAFLNAIQSAQAPERFTTKFLKDLDFTSSNDRMFIAVLKGLGFIDENGVPTTRYFSFLDHSQSRKVLADAVREAYGDLFALNRGAQDLDLETIKGKFKSLTQGQKTEHVVRLMANTFKDLAALADWSALAEPSIDEKKTLAVETPPAEVVNREKDAEHITRRPFASMGLHYNIQVILPESRDPAVYDALFSSLRRHLM